MMRLARFKTAVTGAAQKTRSSLSRHGSLFRTPVRHMVHFTESKMKANAAMTAKEVTVTATPLAGESRDHFKTRVKAEVAKVVFKKENAHQELVMSYPTRLAKAHEKVANASNKADLPFVDKPVIAGHCMSTYMDENGQPSNDHTVSLRPDVSKAVIYTAKTAPDDRLPSEVLNQKVYVWPAKHTTVLEEIKRWAEEAYYTNYVHSGRSPYPLQMFFRPVTAVDRARYFNAVNDVKLSFQRYSLLDHFHPYTGILEGQLVAGQNCTIIADVLEKMASVNMKELVGDNPTPQVVFDTIKKYYAKVVDTNHATKDEMSMPFRR